MSQTSRSQAKKHSGGAATREDAKFRRILRSSHIFSSVVRDILDGDLVRAVSPEPLTLAQFRLLKLIALDGDPQVGEVASSLGISAAAACKNLDTLERLGLVARGGSPIDRRATILSASDAGRRVVRDYEELTGKRMAAVLEAVCAERLDDFCDLLEKVSLELLSEEDAADETCLRCAGYYDRHCPLRELDRSCPSNLERGSRGG